MVSRTSLNGKTVAEALAAAVSLCFSSGLLLQDQFLYLFLGREQRNRGELASRIQMVENLLDISRIQSGREKIARVEIDLAQLQGLSVQAAWYDPRTGKNLWLSSYPTRSVVAFTPPSDGPDWVLVLDAQ